ncbi:MAG: ATP-binding protein [Paracoccus sp. (in: a-proteobacteria)]|uniref:ATP-binding protein n=1 Tax=Paracoccus sp. TaxID=267 RepID=UPI0026E008A5|nr:ATP-binding protein [Paracoccus sp. (in: a-proteobacteria)]MDO5621249.1 ATP-binding protein [Paracoccus sp. (in: a-proteobacteria)]
MADETELKAEVEGLRRALYGLARATASRDLAPVQVPALPSDSADALSALMAEVGGCLQQDRVITDALDSLRDGFLVVDQQARVRHTNRAFRRFFQPAITCVPGIHVSVLVIAAVRHQLVLLPGERILDWFNGLPSNKGAALMVPAPDGVIMRWYARRMEDGSTAVLATDVTETLRRQRELEAANRDRDRLSSAQATLLANMSHELRTPVTGVIGLADLLGDSGLSPEQARLARTIRDSGEALLRLVNDILDFSRGQSGRLRIDTQPFSLRSLIDSVLTLLGPQAEGKGLTLRARFSPGLADGFVGDPGRLRQVLMNLVGNALKFTVQGGAVLHLDAGRGGKGLILRVEDSGTGIPEERQDDVFQEFVQLDLPGHRATGGTGLGLTITRHLVEAMGGRIWLFSDGVTGTTFGCNLDLPLAEGVDVPVEWVAPPPVQPEGVPAHIAADDPGLHHVLIADDNATNRMLLDRFIQQTGLQIHHASNGAEALDLWRDWPFALIFMDISMPLLNGLDATARIRQAEAVSSRPRVPIIATTAYAEDGIRDRIIAAGLDGLLHKPFRRADILAVMAGFGLSALPAAQIGGAA